MIKIKEIKWHFRNSKIRKEGKNKGKHPALIFAKANDNKKYYNIGLTHSDKRGHHHNIEIYNPENWKNKSYLRNDISNDDIHQFEKVLKNFKVNPKDKTKIQTLINKFKKKNNIK